MTNSTTPNKASIKFPGEPYESFLCKSKWNAFVVESKSNDGDVEITFEGNNNFDNHYINQDDLKLLIKFLQKQVIQPKELEVGERIETTNSDKVWTIIKVNTTTVNATYPGFKGQYARINKKHIKK